MKPLIILLLLASVAWSGESTWIDKSDCPHGSICAGNDCTCLDNPVINVYPKKTEIKLPQKGHCPHCGVRGMKWGEILKGSEYMFHREGALLFLCPNGHMFWEKD
jgi:hypothetical protein